MGDSDDDYDRRRARDKFRRERSDYQERRGDERGRREDYVDSRRELWTRDRGGRRDYRDVDMRRRERYSPPRHDMSPPMKKMRRTWDDHGGYGNYDVPYSGSSIMDRHQNWGGAGPELAGNTHAQYGYGPGSAGHRDMDLCPTQPPMMAFKQFLGSQDDSISDEEAVRKYNDYKDEFRRQQLNEFFLSHKEEEWFKSKYQPEECSKRRQEQLNALKKRVDVFFELLDKERMDGVAVDIDKGEEIIRLLDAVVIKLEGGSDRDLDVLDEPIPELEKPEKSNFSAIGLMSNKVEAAKKSDSCQNVAGQEEKAKSKREENRPKPKKRSRNEDGEEEDGEEGKLNYDNEESVSDWEKEIDDDSGRPDSASSSTGLKSEKMEETPAEPEAVKADEKVKEEAETKEEDEDEVKPKEELEEGEKDDLKSEEGNVDAVKSEPASNEDSSPRALHKTCSIFLRNLAPTITKQEVEAMCRRFPGFLRVAIADPQPERRFFRRGWVTFERGVNIKETCWHLNNIRLRDCELGAIVNRDLTRRIRACNGITSHKQVVRADIKLAAKIIQTLDKRHNLWTDSQDQEENGQLGFGLISRNPLLKNITDYLIEEADAEEEELLGKSALEEAKKDGEGGTETTVERDEALIKVVDRLLLYLRIIHSVDYYNHSDYPNEDEMPNRCGIMHARGPAPSIRVTQTDINDYMNTFENKMSPFLQPLTKLADDDAQKLGRKDPAAEVEKFITANTQELGKDKWLCPLSGKKFKGPEFVKKHIFNKHGEKVEEVKKEVEYFNNYLMDPKRPQLPEHPGNRPPREPGAREGFGHPGGGYPHPPPYGFPYPNARMPGNYSSGFGGRGGYNDNYRGGGGFYHKRGGGRNRGDPREIIGYHDLDAPDLEESF